MHIFVADEQQRIQTLAIQIVRQSLQAPRKVTLIVMGFRTHIFISIQVVQGRKLATYRGWKVEDLVIARQLETKTED